MFKTKFFTCVLVFLCTCFFGVNLFAQTQADSTWPMFHHDLYHTGLSPLTGFMDTCYFFWSYTTGDRIYSSPALGDIDGDEKLEVVFGSWERVYALNGEDGSHLWSYTTGVEVSSSPALGDIDGDGKLEVVIGSGSRVYARNGEDGSHLWLYTTGGRIYSSPALGDIDGDGKLEVVIGSYNDNVYGLNGEDGSLLWSKVIGSNDESSPALGDIDGDGKLEVVIGSVGQIYARNGEDGSTLWSYIIGEQVYVSSPALGDIDSDEKLEVVIGYENRVFAMNGEDGSLLWSDTTGKISSSPALGDIDGDGKLEVVIGSNDNNVYGLNGEDGSFLWSYTTGNCVESSPALGDIDDDGKLEVVIGSDDGKVYTLGEMPDIALADSIHNFGDVNVSDSSDWTFNIFNLGNDTLDVDSLKNNKFVYQVISPSFPLNIPFDDSVDVTIGFIPGTIKAYQDTLSIFSNDPDEPVVYIYLTGNGVAKPPAAPIDLTANGSNPSHWTRDSTFIINWTNPPDVSGIARALYKSGSEPASNYDTTGSMSPAPPDTIFSTIEGSIPMYVWLEDSSDNVDYNNNSSVNLRRDITPPSIDSTTVLDDTSYSGPFPVYAIVTDFSSVDSVVLYYKRQEDFTWFFKRMVKGANNWYHEFLPQVFLENDTVKYYILANDIATSCNESTDPPGAPANYYSFIVRTSGIEEGDVKPKVFSFGVNSIGRNTTVFKVGLPDKTDVYLNIYDVMGRIVSSPVSGSYSSGYYNIPFKPEKSGIYFYLFKSAYGEKKGKIIVF